MAAHINAEAKAQQIKNITWTTGDIAAATLALALAPPERQFHGV